MCIREQWWLYCTSQCGGRCFGVIMCTVWPLHSKWLSKQSNKSASTFALSLNITPQEQLGCFRRPQLWATGDCHFHHCSTPTHTSHLVKSYFVKHQITQVTQPPDSPDLEPCDFWLSPKPKSPLKGKRFQIIDESQENTMGQLMAIGRTMWGPKVPTLKETEVSLSSYEVSCIFFNKCLYFFIFHGWISSGQTFYIIYLEGSTMNNVNFFFIILEL